MREHETHQCIRLMSATNELNQRDGVRSHEMLTDAMMAAVKARHPGITEAEWQQLLQAFRQQGGVDYSAAGARLATERRRLSDRLDIERAVREGLPGHYSLTLCATIKAAIGPPRVAALAQRLLDSDE